MRVTAPRTVVPPGETDDSAGCAPEAEGDGVPDAGVAVAADEEPSGADFPPDGLTACTLLLVFDGEDGENDEDTGALDISVSVLYRLGLAVPKTMDMDAEPDAAAVGLATAGA